MLHNNKDNFVVPSEEAVSVVDEGSELVGDFHFLGTLVVRGKLKGKVIYGDTLLVADTGEVEADCRVNKMILKGRLQGDVSAKERLELRPTARANGNITTPLLAVEEGAELTGDVKIMGEPAEVIPSVVEEPAQSNLVLTPLAVAGCSLSSSVSLGPWRK